MIEYCDKYATLYSEYKSKCILLSKQERKF